MIKQKLFGGNYEGKIVFLTGHTGFQGAWLTLWLNYLGATVIGYSLPPPTKPSLFDTLNFKKKITSIIGNINDKKNLFLKLSKYKPDIVIHLAAQALVRESYENPIETFMTNIIGTANILESIREISSVKSCLVMTSDKCYENKQVNYAYRESDPMGGYDPYSASKGAAEIIVSSYKRSFFKQKKCPGIATIRAGNVIGGGDWAKDRIIPDCVRALLSHKKIILRNPNAIRPWQYVLEPLSGLLLLGSKLQKNPQKFGGAWNFGPLTSNDVSVRSLVMKLLKKWGGGKIDIKKQKLHEAQYLRLSSNKALNLLKWHPVYSIKKSIDETVNWYLNYQKNKNDVYDFTLSQLNSYVNKAQQMNSTWTK